MWNIYGNTYDLSIFLDYHPGGKDILLMTENLYDCTPLFESYHNFGNKIEIKKKLQKYMIKENTYDQPYTFNKDDFYNKVSKRVISYFIDNKIYHKITFISILKYIGLFFSWLSFLYLSVNTQYLYMKILFSFISGLSIGSIGYCVMHDILHFAIFKNPIYNLTFGKIVQCFMLWNGSLWLKHHLVNHHSFTGSNNKLYQDPDYITFEPLYKKYKDGKSILINKPSYIYFIITSIIPGMYVGQMIIYLKWIIKGKMWRMKLPNNFEIETYEKFFYLLNLYILSHLNIYALISYFIALNITYSINIIGDHDTYETYINSIDSKYEKITDWGAKQVIESGNWCDKIWCFFFGGINYQIEHHLFPNVHHAHYPAISKIVKETCKEFDIPYIHHKTIFNVITSYYKKIKMLNSK
jgi:linoleoyl-CoA desaturase